MNVVGIALIVIGLALVCGGLILWSRGSQTWRASKTGTEAAPVSGMADLLRRLNEVSDDNFFNKQRATRITARGPLSVSPTLGAPASLHPDVPPRREHRA